MTETARTSQDLEHYMEAVSRLKAELRTAREALRLVVSIWRQNHPVGTVMLSNELAAIEFAESRLTTSEDKG